MKTSVKLEITRGLLTGLAVLAVVFLISAAGIVLLAPVEPYPTNDTAYKQLAFGRAAISIGGITIDAEVADSFEEVQQGLMHRTHLPDNQGMFFVFPDPRQSCMWMLNTLIDLDVAFINLDYEIIHIASMSKGSTKIHCPPEPTPYALEMNRGGFQSAGITTGSRVGVVNKDPSETGHDSSAL